MKDTFNAALKQLGWPSEKVIFNPPGKGAQYVTDLAKRKIGDALEKELDAFQSVKVGSLTAEPNASESIAPIAIICKFSNRVSTKVQAKAQQLAWNFSRSALLVTIEPTRVRTWTCCELPERDDWDLFSSKPASSSSPELTEHSVDAIIAGADRSLHWTKLVTGSFFEEHRDRFQEDGRASIKLLENLREVRLILSKQGLSFRIIHDLLARIIFVQFLFHREDSSGYSALSAERLDILYQEGTLSQPYETLEQILGDHEDAYSLFRLLDRKFNGDLFPERSQSLVEATTDEWANEMEAVDQPHLDTLALFVGGKLEFESGQFSLWPNYLFDAIPLEFISSVYEEFVGGSDGIYYTPPYLADYVLDAVLPWNGNDWQVSVLDPACGSGVFLVKAYQRLVFRWKQSNPEKENPSAKILRQLLTRCIHGVDRDPDAVRVASFSLYLAMCDEIEPRYYWKQVRFPTLRSKNLLVRDFFDDSVDEVFGSDSAKEFDLIIGNPPWGGGTISDDGAATEWVYNSDWKDFNKDIGPLFLAKSLDFASEGGKVAMLQGASTLFNDRTKDFRSKLFSNYEVEEVTNLSKIRFKLFRGAVGPACCFVVRKGLSPGKNLGQKEVQGDYAIRYVCPTSENDTESDYAIVVGAYDVHDVYSGEVTDGSIGIWTALVWGSRRDYQLLDRLRRDPNLKDLKERGVVTKRNGFIRGKEETQRYEEKILNKPILEQPEFPEGTLLQLDPSRLPVNKNPGVKHNDSVTFTAFEAPQLVAKRSWKKSEERLRAAVVPETESGVICDQNYITVNTPVPSDRPVLDAACVTLNSFVGVYYMLLTSDRFATYRPNLRVKDLLDIPVPLSEKGENLTIDEAFPKDLDAIESMEQVDRIAERAFSLKESEKIMISDLIEYTLPDFKNTDRRGGQSKTERSHPKRGPEADLFSYCSTLLSVFDSTFGSERISATIFSEGTKEENKPLSVRMVAFSFEKRALNRIKIEHLSENALYEKLASVSSSLVGETDGSQASVSYHQVFQHYTVERDGDSRIPIIYLIKPDRIDYWSRSTALRDADSLAEMILAWKNTSSQPVLATAE